ncbi:MAG: hypothetical protein JSR77_15040 [Planctomycetes bacterium]|nr:hypothetical protein [Planctomycetota bacterium]
MRLRHACAAALLALAAPALAQTGYTITGYMSNFDCTNRCDYDCDELEVDIEGVHPEDIVHTYHNGNYGPPSVTLSADGSYTIVDYRNPQHLTRVNSIEHFGITIRGAAYYGPAPDHPIRIRWFRDGHVATVNGQVPNPDGSGSAPATQPIQPSIAATVTSGSHGQGGVTLTVTNNDPVQPIWIMRRATIFPGSVTLEALMPDDPVVTSTIAIDSAPLLVAPLASIRLAEDLIEVEEDQSAVFAARYFQNLVGAGPFSHNAPGAELGNVMTATLASPQLACAHSIPTITSQPQSVTQDAGTRVDLRVSGRGDDASPLTYQWMRDGVNLGDGNGVSGSTSNHLRINTLSAATEGFYSVRITNTCASIVSNSALVFITGHNTPPVHQPECPAITSQPVAAAGCVSDTHVFAIAATGSDPMAFRWRLVGGNGASATDLFDGNYFDPSTGLRFTVSGSWTNVLRVSGFSLGNSPANLAFAARVTNTCGEVNSGSANLSLCACLACPADFNQDGGVDGADVERFFSAWQASNCDADVNQDGGVDGGDVESFFAAWEGGGC